MFESIEDFELEWDIPKPEKPIRFNNRTNIWYKRLKSMKQFPGRTARIMKGIETYKLGNQRAAGIRRGLHIHDSYDRWTIDCGKEDDGTWGIWATYEGRMTETEHEADELARRKRSEEALRQRRRRELTKQTTLARSAASGALRPPRVQ